MSVVGNFVIPAEAFALQHTLTAVPDLVVEADQMASHSTMEVMPFVWATDGDTAATRRALEDDPTISDVTVADEVDDEVLYRIEWSDEFCDLIDEMVGHHAAILTATRGTTRGRSASGSPRRRWCRRSRRTSVTRATSSRSPTSFTRRRQDSASSG